MRIKTKFNQGDVVNVWHSRARQIRTGKIEKVKVYSQDSGKPRIYYTVGFDGGYREGYIESMIGRLPPRLRGALK